MSIRLQLSALLYMLIQAVLFGFGIVVILATPLSAQANTLIPIMVGGTAIVSAPIAWFSAPLLRRARTAPGS